MGVLLGTVFVASLLGSLHCVGMCGPFALLAGSGREQRSAAVLPTAAYSFGRLVTYSVVGLVFGSLGMALNQGAGFSSMQQTATWFAGGLMILIGVVALARYLGLRIKLPQIFTPFQRILQSAFAKTVAMQPLPRAATIGALTSLMPCGWLYTFAITAAGTGSPLWGMILMATFWAGTVPIMSALMLGFNQIDRRFQQRLPVVMAGLVIGLGLFTLAFRAPVALGSEAKVISGVEQLTEQVNQIDHDQLPCCRSKSSR